MIADLVHPFPMKTRSASRYQAVSARHGGDSICGERGIQFALPLRLRHRNERSIPVAKHLISSLTNAALRAPDPGVRRTRLCSWIQRKSERYHAAWFLRHGPSLRLRAPINRSVARLQECRRFPENSCRSSGMSDANRTPVDRFVRAAS
jgi:hypothetical protein